MTQIAVIDRIAKERGIDPVVLVRNTLKEQGSVYRAAIALDVTPNTLRNWCKVRGYKFAIRTQRTADLERAE